jgi:hypothetical protein
MITVLSAEHDAMVWDTAGILTMPVIGPVCPWRAAGLRERGKLLCGVPTVDREEAAA